MSSITVVTFAIPIRDHTKIKLPSFNDVLYTRTNVGSNSIYSKIHPINIEQNISFCPKGDIFSVGYIENYFNEYDTVTMLIHWVEFNQENNVIFKWSNGILSHQKEQTNEIIVHEIGYGTYRRKELNMMFMELGKDVPW